MRHCFLTYDLFNESVNHTPKNLKESLYGIGVMLKLLSVILNVYDAGDTGRGFSLFRGSRLHMRIALKKLIFVLLKL